MFWFIGWAFVSSLFLFALFPNWLSTVFIASVWLPMSLFVGRQLYSSFINEGHVILETDKITLCTGTGLCIQGHVNAGSVLFDPFIAIKITGHGQPQWLLFLASSVDATAWSRLRRAVVMVKEGKAS